MNFSADDAVSYVPEPHHRKADQPVSGLLSPTLGDLEDSAELFVPPVGYQRKTHADQQRLLPFSPPKGAHRVGSYLVGPLDDKLGKRRAVSTLNPSAGRLDCFVSSVQDGRRQLSLRIHLDEPEWLPAIVDTLVVGDWMYVFSVPTYGSLLDEFSGDSVCGTKESRAVDIFGQMVDIVHYCHCRGVILRDLTLRCFAFKEEAR